MQKKFLKNYASKKEFDYLQLKSEDFPKEEVESYAKKRFSSIDQKIVDRREKKIIKSFLKNLNGLRILDIPCGYGRMSEILSKHGYLVNSDYSMNMLIYSKIKNKNIPHLRCDIRNLPFKDGSFGLIICLRFFHHMEFSEYFEHILKELHRITSDKAIISIYGSNMFHILWRKIFKKKGKILFLKKGEIETLIKKTGFRILSIKKILPLLHGQKIVLLQKSTPS